MAMAGGTLRRQLWYRLSPSSETRRQAASGTSPKRFRDRSGGSRGSVWESGGGPEGRGIPEDKRSPGTENDRDKADSRKGLMGTKGPPG